MLVRSLQIIRSDLAELAHAAFHQRQVAVLIGQRLAMLERQIEEHAIRKRVALIEAARDRLGRDLARPRVAEERLGLAAIDVAAELIEQDEQRQRAIRRGAPAIEAAHLRLVHQRTEALADL